MSGRALGALIGLILGTMVGLGLADDPAMPNCPETRAATVQCAP